MLIFDWRKEVKQLQGAESRETAITKIAERLEEVINCLWQLNPAIIRTEDYRIEISPLYEVNENILLVTKSFEERSEYNELKNQLDVLTKKIKDALRDSPEELNKFERYLELKSLNSLLYDVKIVITRNNKSIIKVKHNLQLETIKPYIMGLLGMKLEIE